MPINIMTWNIQNFGLSKYKALNRQARFDVIAELVLRNNIHILCLQELYDSSKNTILQYLLNRLNANPPAGVTWGTLLPTPSGIYATSARPTNDIEAYAILWRTDANAGFTQLVQTGAPVEGVSAAPFPKNWSKKGGRSVAYVGFQSTATGNQFIVTNYHAPSFGNAAATGLQAFQAMPELTQAFAANHRALCGDYNLDYNIWNNFQPFEMATNTQSTVSGFTIMEPLKHIPTPRPANAAGYLSQTCIDNIFVTPAIAPPPPGPAGTIINTIDELYNSPPTQGTVWAQGNNFQLGPPAPGTVRDFPNISQTALPLNTYFRAYIVARYGISDHLPVITSITV